jgi:hypothetical protein
MPEKSAETPHLAPPASEGVVLLNTGRPLEERYVNP